MIEEEDLSKESYKVHKQGAKGIALKDINEVVFVNEKNSVVPSGLHIPVAFSILSVLSACVYFCRKYFNHINHM